MGDGSRGHQVWSRYRAGGSAAARAGRGDTFPGARARETQSGGLCITAGKRGVGTATPPRVRALRARKGGFLPLLRRWAMADKLPRPPARAASSSQASVISESSRREPPVRRDRHRAHPGGAVDKILPGLLIVDNFQPPQKRVPEECCLCLQRVDWRKISVHCPPLFQRPVGSKSAASRNSSLGFPDVDIGGVDVTQDTREGAAVTLVAVCVPADVMGEFVEQ